MNKRHRITAVFLAASLILFNQAAFAQPPQNGGSSAVKQAASRVIAVADTQTNSVVVSAPDELMPMIDELMAEIDAVGDDAIQVRVFPLQYADATEMSTVVSSIFDVYGTSGGGGRGGGRGGQMGGRGGGRGGRGGGFGQTNEDMVLAAPDLRTNSVIVSAKGSKMKQIEQTIKDLDTNPAKEQKVHVYTLENADPAALSTILQEMVDQQASRSGTATGTGANRSRQNTQNRNTSNTNTQNQQQSNQFRRGASGGTGNSGR